MRPSILACPSWCQLGEHDGTPTHVRRLLHTERDGMTIAVFLSQVKEHYDRPTPSGGRAGRVHIGPPTVGVMWERDPDEYNIRTFDLAAGVAELLAPVLETLFGPNDFAAALIEAVALIEAEDRR
ncbi:hypothetical protein HTZ77_18535 [Nonomuraea sp. SMC257]|uniref:Uncharacterized protein n=1 Tax=Nonomuraea montanisoli TaxID=2741721 RepID=A0A7Y6I817_9ACTN|nr:hypothetical protein [Nonomuraea montanisoli]NUW33412.1 hypothetical protein [Nonomuraea montanisoli]